MRGKVFQAILALLGARITPAHAGKSFGNDLFFAIARDHPRPCGEKEVMARATEWLQGSPPPMRGKDADGQ